MPRNAQIVIAGLIAQVGGLMWVLTHNVVTTLFVFVLVWVAAEALLARDS